MRARYMTLEYGVTCAGSLLSHNEINYCNKRISIAIRVKLPRTDVPKMT